MLPCDHKPLEQFFSCGMKIHKLEHWSIELSDYNLTFFYIKGTDDILADTISRLKMPKMYMENPKTATLNNTEEYALQKWLKIKYKP